MTNPKDVIIYKLVPITKTIIKDKVEKVPVDKIVNHVVQVNHIVKEPEPITHIIKQEVPVTHTIKESVPEPVIEKVPEPQPVVERIPEPQPVVEKVPEPQPVVESQPAPVEQVTLPHTGLPSEENPYYPELGVTGFAFGLLILEALRKGKRR